ncbi:MAG: ElyC/SanA/YdcF family protein [Sulfurovum sp.]
MFINSNKKARFFIFSAFVWLLLVSNQSVSNALIKPLENSHPALLEAPDVQYILVLGNGHTTNENLSITSQVNATAINRLAEGIKHYKNLKARNLDTSKNTLKEIKLIVSGYRGSDINTHAKMQEKLAISMGVDKNDIIRLDSPKDTPQEAKEVKKIVQDKSFILVTSASHMKRSMLIFKKQNLNSIAAPTNYKSHESSSYSSHFNASNIKKTELAIHEYLGIAWGKIRGLI